jgi:hypothetical protein
MCYTVKLYIYIYIYIYIYTLFIVEHNGNVSPENLQSNNTWRKIQAI